MPECTSPGSVIGILGGGQLSKMIALAAAAMGYRAAVYSPDKEECAKWVTKLSFDGEYLDFSALDAFATACDVITYEFENIPLATVEHLEKKGKVRPASSVLSICQNRLREKSFITSIGVPTNRFAEIRSAADIRAHIDGIGYPAVLKTAEMGYDGKGQAVIRKESDITAAWESLNTASAILEEFVDFTKEISALVARNKAGEVVVYPLAENTHKHHILDTTIVPARVSKNTEAEASSAARIIAEKIGLVGILAIEMFVTKDGNILVNELAPRPHNSGHWTIEGAATSQYEQLVRAICGLPLGPVDLLFPTRMQNLIGDEVNSWQSYYADKSAKVHLYGKGAPRKGRKMGHITWRNRSA